MRCQRLEATRVTDEGFDQVFGPGRGVDRPAPGEPSALDAVRDAVAELDASGRELSPEDRIGLCETSVGAFMRERGVELGDGYYVNAFGGSVSSRGGADGELRPVTHESLPAGQPPIALLFLHYGYEPEKTEFAELWLRDLG